MEFRGCKVGLRGVTVRENAVAVVGQSGRNLSRAPENYTYGAPPERINRTQLLSLDVPWDLLSREDLCGISIAV